MTATMVALKRGNSIRLQRAALRREVSEMNRLRGRARVASLLLNPPDEIQTMAIFDLLCWIHRVGRSQARGVLNTADEVGLIRENRRIKDLTSRQRVALAQFLHGQSWGPC